MISFGELNSENIDSVSRSLAENLGDEAASELLELIYGIDTECEDVAYAVSVYASCLLIRIFDMGRYLFVYPCELDGNADVRAAIDAVAEYAMREELPLVFVDTPGELLSTFSGYRHIDIDADDLDASVYRVRIKTECELAEKIPSVMGDRVNLTPLSEGDISLYAKLCRDKNVNKYWGYDYSEDVKNPSDAYFFESASADFALGTAMTMAVRVGGEFIGEATLYAFDGRGGAEFAVRILPDWQGKGLGGEAAVCTLEAARKIGLVRIYARVMKENESSLAMLRGISDGYTEAGGDVIFTVEL